MFPNHSTALLPTSTRINPQSPADNEYYEGTDTLLVVASNRSNGLTVAKSSGAMPDVHVGDRFEAHHDQQGYAFGTLRVVGIVREGGGHEGDVPNKKLSLRVYK